MSPQAPRILLGSGGGIIPTSTPEEVTGILARLKTLASPIYGIDTAAVYGGSEKGKSERILGAAGIAGAGLVLDTKVLFYGPDGPGDGREKDGGPLSRANVLRSSKESLERLKVGRVRCLYAHQVDRNTPIAETVGAFGEVLKAGEAEVWGLSNFSPNQVREVIKECEKQSVPKPQLYQGMYHAICRKLETELFPVLRENGIKYYAYSPTAGGLLTDRVAGSGGKELPSRTASNPRGAERFKERYGKPEILDSLLKLHATCAKEGSTVQGASLRWLAYHSKLGAEDAVILGASKVEQVDDSAAEIAKGPLKEDIVGQFERVWQSVKDVAPVGYSD